MSDQDDYHTRRLRCYEFSYIVPWSEIIDNMESKTDE